MYEEQLQQKQNHEKIRPTKQASSRIPKTRRNSFAWKSKHRTMINVITNAQYIEEYKRL